MRYLPAPPVSGFFRPAFIAGVAGCVLASAAAILLTGCGVGNAAAADAPSNVALTVRGQVYGGQSPISGAKIELWTAGNGTHNSTPSSYGTGAQPLGGGNPVYTQRGNGYFSFPTAITSTDCANAVAAGGSQYAYLTATGGDPTGNTIQISPFYLSKT